MKIKRVAGKAFNYAVITAYLLATPWIYHESRWSTSTAIAVDLGVGIVVFVVTGLVAYVTGDLD